MLTRAAAWAGIPAVAGWERHERERALLRLAVCCAVVAIDLVRTRDAGGGLPLGVLVAIGAYGLLGLGFHRSLRAPRPGHAGAAAAFLLADPLALLLPIAADPETFAFLVPLVLVVHLGPGLLYGPRALALSLATGALAAAALLASGPFWRREPAWSASLLLALVLVPVVVRARIRRVAAPRVEEERAAVRDRAVFLSKVSHELRSPLQSMVSALDVFEMRHRDAARDDAELVSRMRRASLLLNTQLRDLLTLAKGEAGRLELRPLAFDATELLHALAEAARPLAQAKGLQLHVEAPAEPQFVVADGARVDQILTNLVVNSIRYTDAGTVRVALRPFDAAEGLLHVTVADTGRGIRPDELPTLFLPERAGATTARRGEGSGIGLAIVRILLEQLGGRVSVASGVDAGTTFTVEIPAERSAPERAEDGASADVRAAEHGG
jgi:signal transduction histidine kinase